ncbi:hypothetical protein RB594_007354 [Gaeumannomyces avenae]
MAASVRSEPGRKVVPTDDSGDRASGSLGNEYCYSPLPHHSIRLLRLLPHKDKEAPIRCQLLEYSLQEPGQGIHLYEALSYVWGSEENKLPIYVQSTDRGGGSPVTPATGNDHCLLVTANLHEALSCVRNRHLERVLWIDAVCIDQGNDEEKGWQVQSMAKIYANANRVIVWLGEAVDNGDRALQGICVAAQEHMDPASYQSGHQATPAHQPANSAINRQAILKLLQRPWFQRIWVLQEVAAARNIVVKCGAVEIDGHAFCSGMDALKPYQSSQELSSLIRSIAYLVRGASFRPRLEHGLASSRGPSLGIRSLSELVDMYHDRKATERRDKVYALLGMSLDDPSAAGLSANYETSWKDVFRKLIQFCLSDQVRVSTWDASEVAVVDAKGYLLGRVTLIQEDYLPQYGSQTIGVTWECVPGYLDTEGNRSINSTSQASVKTIEKGDFFCLIKGAPAPTIVRLRDGFWTIVRIALPRTNDVPKWTASGVRIPANLLLIWDWDESRKSQGGKDYEDFISSREVPKCSKAGCKFQDAIRWWNLGVALNGIERYREAAQNFRKAVEISSLGAVSRSEGNTGHVCCRKEDENAMRAMNELDGRSAAMEAGCKSRGYTPLWWAVEGGCEAFTRLLLENGAVVEAKRSQHEMLNFAVGQGSVSLTKLLVEQGDDLKCDGRGEELLCHAVKKGREAVARLLLVEMGVSTGAPYEGAATPLHFAACKGHEAIVRLLVELGADIAAKNNHEETPLHLAAYGGHEAVVRLLVDQGADIEARNNYGETPLHLAAYNGYEAAARLLVDQGADIEARDAFGRTPLQLAVENGHEAVAMLFRS